MRRVTRMLPLALAGAIALSACDGQTAEFEDSDTSAAQQESQGQDEGAEEGGTEEDTQSDVEADSAAAAGVDLSDVAEPLATATIPATVEGDPDAAMQVALHGLVRDGDVVVGTFSFEVDSDASGAQPRWIYHYLGDQSWQPHFIDTVNLTRHDVVSSSGKKAATDSQSFKFLPGQTAYAYAVFAAPPEDVTTVTLSLVEGAPTAEVELQ
ncbi:hypothetical protein [Serinicoccus kebangsaanensis]|uniref:hypothetical protein n=1 Tax=Serinicoccus kebangsaanensis TaxID=2602069 RepID=UPI00178C4391|nr:hypothetical protein [Serinicoccus kebangsaanensis]